MQFKFCPNCGGISTMQPHAGLQKCSRCNFVGEPKEGTAAEANALVRRIKSGINPLTNAQAIQGKPAPEKKDASSMNAIKESALKENSDKKKIDYVPDERLKSLKGKKSDNFEFL